MHSTVSGFDRGRVGVLPRRFVQIDSFGPRHSIVGRDEQSIRANTPQHGSSYLTCQLLTRGLVRDQPFNPVSAMPRIMYFCEMT
jgi:hypothetical protein